MKIRLKSLTTRNQGGIFFWILAFIVVVVIALILVKLYSVARKIDQFKPRWDDVNHHFTAEMEKMRAEYGTEADIQIDAPELMVAGFGRILRSTNFTDWELLTNNLTPDQLNEWQMPPPDPAVPMMLYDLQWVETWEEPE